MPAEAIKGTEVGGNVGVSTEVVSDVSAARSCSTLRLSEEVSASALSTTPSLELWLKSNSLMAVRPIVVTEGNACWRPEAAPSSGKV